jgi:hypothetical protein
MMVSNTAIKNSMNQYGVFRDPQKRLELQRWVLKEKLQSQINFLESVNNPELGNGISKLKEYRSSR